MRYSKTADVLTEAYWNLIGQYLSHQLCPHEICPESRKAWLQTGLAMSLLLGTVAQHSIAVIIACPDR